MHHIKPMNRGGVDHRADFFRVVIVSGILLCYIHYELSPRFYSEIHDTKNGKVIIRINYKNYPNIKNYEHNNLECLKKKGYNFIETSMFKREFDIDITKKDIDIKELLSDCKTCNVYSDIEYTYQPPLMDGRYKDNSTRLHWDSCQIRKYLE